MNIFYYRRNARASFSRSRREQKRSKLFLSSTTILYSAWFFFSRVYQWTNQSEKNCRKEYESSRLRQTYSSQVNIVVFFLLPVFPSIRWPCTFDRVSLGQLQCSVGGLLCNEKFNNIDKECQDRKLCEVRILRRKRERWEKRFLSNESCSILRHDYTTLNIYFVVNL